MIGRQARLREAVRQRRFRQQQVPHTANKAGEDLQVHYDTKKRKAADGECIAGLYDIHLLIVLHDHALRRTVHKLAG
jgi:hypothetical protein